MGLIFDEKDVKKTLFLRRPVMREKTYEKENRLHYRILSNCRWHLQESNGNILSSNDLA
jgi:hypothetical protein